MKTFKLKEAITVLSRKGFIQEPDNHFSTHACLYDEKGEWIGKVTYDCYFEICETLGYFNCGGLLKNDKTANNSSTYFFQTVNGDFSVVQKLKEAA